MARGYDYDEATGRSFCRDDAIFDIRVDTRIAVRASGNQTAPEIAP
jgi:hypothetical protein